MDTINHMGTARDHVEMNTASGDIPSKVETSSKVVAPTTIFFSPREESIAGIAQYSAWMNITR